MSATEPLGGRLWLAAGRPRLNNLRSTRPDWVARLTHGLPAQRLGVTLASLFSLCGHVHRLCAGLAVEAALGHEAAATPAQHMLLAQQTLREHLSRIALDWPQQLGGGAHDAAGLDAAARWLVSCPAFAAVPSDAAAWLESHAIGMPPDRWLDAWEHDPAALMSAWTHDGDVLPARLLREAASGRQAVVPLHVHAEAATMQAWAEDLRNGGSAFARQPTWRGACAETGAWTRLTEIDPMRFDTPALKMGARVAEVVRLGLHDTDRLAVGALPLASGEAIAWVEMARGLLVHHVQLDGCDDNARVEACHVVAPTEWNFHPRGAVATVLESITSDAPGRVLDTWMAAYDPCVPYQQESTVPQELAHA